MAILSRGGLTDPFQGMVAGDVPQRVQTATQEAESARTGIVEREKERKTIEDAFLKQREEAVGEIAGRKGQIEKGFAEQYTKLLESPEYKEQQITEFIPSQSNQQDMMALFGAMSALAFLSGGSGRYSGMAGLENLTGAMEGWNKGRQDLFKQELLQFDKNLKATQEHNRSVQRRLEDAIKMLTVNKDAALGELKVLEAELGNSELAYNIRSGRFDRADKIARDAIKASDRVIEQWQKTLERREEKSADFQARAELAAIRSEMQADKSSRATQQMFIAQRAVTALRGAASAAESIMKLPEFAQVGMLPFLSNKPGLMNFLETSAVRKITGSEAKALETLFTGISRYLATIEASGTATGLVSLSAQLDKLKPTVGDTTTDVALKMADIRRISTESIQAMIASGLFPAQQATAAQEQVDRMERAIPYTTDDVVNAIARGRRTIGTGTTGVAQPSAAPQEGQRSTSKSGKPIVFRNGQWEYE